jgi:hypothetical protein
MNEIDPTITTLTNYFISYDPSLFCAGTRVAVYDMVDNSLFILLVCDILYYCLHLWSIFLFCFILGSSLFSLYNPLLSSLRSTVYTQSSFVSSSWCSLDLIAVVIHTFTLSSVFLINQGESQRTHLVSVILLRI